VNQRGGEENTVTVGGGSSILPSVSKTEAGATWERNQRGGASAAQWGGGGSGTEGWERG
jgi:hypothetical protein